MSKGYVKENDDIHACIILSRNGNGIKNGCEVTVALIREEALKMVMMIAGED